MLSSSSVRESVRTGREPSAGILFRGSLKTSASRAEGRRGSDLLDGVGWNQSSLLPAAQLQKHLAVLVLPDADLRETESELISEFLPVNKISDSKTPCRHVRYLNEYFIKHVFPSQKSSVNSLSLI